MKGRVELWFLPPGCPELSAIEEVWRQMKRAILDVPYVTLARMCEGIDRWAESSVPVLDIEKIPLQDSIVPGPSRKARQWGTLRTAFPFPGKSGPRSPRGGIIWARRGPGGRGTGRIFGFAGYFALNRLNFNLKLCPVSIR